MKDYHINIFWSDEDGGYIADIPDLEQDRAGAAVPLDQGADLEACSAFGQTPKEALAELERAKAAWLEAARAEGKPVPSPRYRAPRTRTA